MAIGEATASFRAATLGPENGKHTGGGRMTGSTYASA